MLAFLYCYFLLYFVVFGTLVSGIVFLIPLFFCFFLCFLWLIQGCYSFRCMSQPPRFCLICILIASQMVTWSCPKLQVCVSTFVHWALLPLECHKPLKFISAGVNSLMTPQLFFSSFVLLLEHCYLPSCLNQSLKIILTSFPFYFYILVGHHII